MIIHVWMHWFWITASLKCFLFIALQMISSSCVSYPFAAGAGLLNNESFAFDNLTMYNLNESSQMDREEREEIPSTSSSLLSSSSSSSTSAISSLVPLLPSSSPVSPVETDVKASEKVASSTAETTILPEVSNSSSSSGGSEETANSSIPRDFSSREATSDVDDTHNEENLDVHQLPTEKSTKFSHSKYGKVKTKTGNGNEKEEREDVKEEVKEKMVEEEKSIETIKLVEEKINISLSDEETTAANGTEFLEPTVVSPLLSYTFDASNGTKETGNGSAAAANESTDLGKFENVTVTSQVPSTNASYQTDGNGTNVNESQVLEDEEDVEDTYKNGSLVIENKVEESVIHTTVEPFPLRNRVAAATSSQTFDLSQSVMNAGSVTGITLGVLVIFGLSGAISFVLYRRRYLNKPQVLHDKCSNLDSSGYIDDASLKENSEEMYSLDNDSFLNSLEAMTIQNYWTESVKHTKL